MRLHDITNILNKIEVVGVKKIPSSTQVFVIESESGNTGFIDKDTFLGSDKYDREDTKLTDVDRKEERRDYDSDLRNRIVRVLKNNESGDPIYVAKKKGFEFQGHIQYNHKNLYNLLGDVTYSYGAFYHHYPDSKDNEDGVSMLHHDHHEWRLEITIKHKNGKKEVVPIILFDWEDEGPVEIVRNSKLFNWSVFSPNKDAVGILKNALGKLKNHDIQLDIHNGEKEVGDDDDASIKEDKDKKFNDFSKNAKQKYNQAAYDRYVKNHETAEDRYKSMKKKRKHLGKLIGEK